MTVSAIVDGCAQAQGGTPTTWRLMLPPMTADGYADSGAPLSRWQKYADYVNETDCRYEISERLFATNANFSHVRRAINPAETAAVEFESAECVQGDDPRLKGN